MGLSCGQARGDAASLVTVNLSLDFVAPARQGQWIEICPTVIKALGSLNFASAVILADGQLCARANATFQALSK